MAKVPWNRVILNEFLRVAYLTPEEEKILKSRISGWSQVKQCNHYHMSIATLNRKIKKLKEKYDSARKYSKILPENIDF